MCAEKATVGFALKSENRQILKRVGNMDHRIEKTKQSIRVAFMELRSRKDLERIKVKELCELAKINKSTFYAYYADVYDLSEQIENEIISDIISGIGSVDDIFSDAVGFTKRLYLSYAEKTALITTVFSGSRKEQLPKRIHAAVKEQVFAKYSQCANDPVKNTALTFSVYGGFYGFSENRKYGDNAVIDLIGEISGKFILELI